MHIEHSCHVENNIVHTVKSLIVAAATIDFERFQRPFLLSKLKELTKGAATIGDFTVYQTGF